MSAGMAYEAMNNAAAAGNRLIVILNDNDMSIAPPVGIAAQFARPAGVSRANISRLAGSRRRSRGRCRSRCTSLRARWRNMRAAWLRAARSSRNSASTMSGRSTGMMSARWSRCSRTSAMPTIGPMLVHVVTQEGQGLRAGREQCRQISRRGQVRRRFRQAGEGRRRAPELYERLRQGAGGGNGARSESRRDHRGDAVGHRARQGRRENSPSVRSTSASPSSMR